MVELNTRAGPPQLHRAPRASLPDRYGMWANWGKLFYELKKRQNFFEIAPSVTEADFGA
jgi:hypothetical protein